MNEFTLDQMLDNMLSAIEAQNYWDSEAWAQMALDYVQTGGTLNPQLDEQDLILQLEGVISTAQKQAQVKNDLIDEIVNFKG